MERINFCESPFLEEEGVKMDVGDTDYYIRGHLSDLTNVSFLVLAHCFYCVHSFGGFSFSLSFVCNSSIVDLTYIFM